MLCESTNAQIGLIFLLYGEQINLNFLFRHMKKRKTHDWYKKYVYYLIPCSLRGRHPVTDKLLEGRDFMSGVEDVRLHVDSIDFLCA